MTYSDFTMKPVFGVLTALILVGSLAVAQDDSGSSSAGAVPAATAPAEQNNVENPPLSGLDQPTAEPAFGGRSYLMPGFQLSESVDSNASGSKLNAHTSEITRALASVDLQKIWRKYQFGLDYIAAGDFYAGPLFVQNQNRATQVHTLAAVQRILWRTGQLAIRDSFDYLPEGSFGFSSYGGAASFGSSLGGGVSGSGAGTGLGGGLGSGGIGSVSYGSLGYQPRIDNTAIVDIVQGISPRSTVTMAGAYSISHYLQVTNPLFPVINSQQAGGQVGYNHLLSRKDQIGLDYRFQEIHFPSAGSGSVTAHVANVLYGHRINGKLNLSLAAGPQLVIVHHPPIVVGNLVTPVPESKSLGANGSVTLGYLASTRTNLQLSYRRYVTPGSGFYAGANTDAVRLSLGYRLGRRWTSMSDGGYSHNTTLQSAGGTTGVPSHSYQFWYGGTSLQRQLGPHFSAFASYQFNALGFGACPAGTSTTCGVNTIRHTGMIGLNWHPRPIRLD
jgi:hypothetical protein